MTETNGTPIHPEGKILLMNGTLLDCFPKETRPETIPQEVLSVDTTGDYFRVKRGPGNSTRPLRTEPWEELFYKEAFFLYEHKDAIFADSRLFLTPLPFKNGLAYTGPSGLQNATLGIYLEWWEACPRAVIRENGKIRALTFFLAGSPLSGCNRCSAVTRKGKTVGIRFPSPFYELWRPFMEINGRYAEAKRRYQAHSLEETITLLHEMEDVSPMI